MRRGSERATEIKNALRKKFRSAQDAARALGIDTKLLAFDGANKMKPTRLQYLLVTGAARCFNPQLAADAKVDYSKLFDGVSRRTLKARKPQIVADAKKMLKGKTLAKDASIEGLAHLLDNFEHVEEPKSLDESVSGSQHKAMEAAAHGHSNLGIPKKVGEEFSHADKGKTFDWDMLHDMLTKHAGMNEDAWEDFKKKASDEMPENALDGEGEETNIEVEEGEDGDIEEEEGEDGEIEEEEGEDHARDKHAKDKAARDKAAKDKAAKDRKGAMDRKGLVTVDEMNKAVAAGVETVKKGLVATQEAREFVRPYVGQLAMALDTAEKIYRKAAEMMHIEDAKSIHPSALKTVIKTVGDAMAAADGAIERADIAQDEANEEGDGNGFTDRFGGAHIVVMPG